MEQKEYKGYNGSLTLTDTGVEIKHGGVGGFFLSGGLKGDKTVPYSRITAVRLQKAGFANNGYIQLSLMGGSEVRGGLAAAASDENAVSFSGSKGNNEKFAEAKQLIEARIGHDSHHSSGIDDLEKLAALKDKGVITQSEFDQKKKQLLGL